MSEKFFIEDILYSGLFCSPEDNIYTSFYSNYNHNVSWWINDIKESEEILSPLYFTTAHIPHNTTWEIDNQNNPNIYIDGLDLEPTKLSVLIKPTGVKAKIHFYDPHGFNISSLSTDNVESITITVEDIEFSNSTATGSINIFSQGVSKIENLRILGSNIIVDAPIILTGLLDIKGVGNSSNMYTSTSLSVLSAEHIIFNFDSTVHEVIIKGAVNASTLYIQSNSLDITSDINVKSLYTKEIKKFKIRGQLRASQEVYIEANYIETEGAILLSSTDCNHLKFFKVKEWYSNKSIESNSPLTIEAQEKFVHISGDIKIASGDLTIYTREFILFPNSRLDGMININNGKLTIVDGYIDEEENLKVNEPRKLNYSVLEGKKWYAAKGLAFIGNDFTPALPSTTIVKLVKLWYEEEGRDSIV